MAASRLTRRASFHVPQSTVRRHAALRVLLCLALLFIAAAARAQEARPNGAAPGLTPVAVRPEAASTVKAGSGTSGKGAAIQGGPGQRIAASFGASTDNDYQIHTQWHDTYGVDDCFYWTQLCDITSWVDNGRECGTWPETITRNVWYPFGPSRNAHFTLQLSWSGSGLHYYYCDGATTQMKPPKNVYCDAPTNDKYVYLHWTKGTDHPDQYHEYRIYRNGVLVTTELGTARSCTAPTVPGDTATWTVTSRSLINGGESEPIPTAGYTLPWYLPRWVTASDTTYVGKVRVTWTADSWYDTHYRVYRDDSLIATLPRSSVEGDSAQYLYDDHEIEDSTRYRYCVVGYNAASTLEAPRICDDGRPYPILPNASDGMYTNRTKITWYDQAPKAEEVKIFRDNDEIGTVSSNATTFYDYDAVPGKLCTYWVAPVTDGKILGRASNQGFVRPNGRIEGNVTTASNVGVRDIELTATPSADTIRRSLSFDGINDVVDRMPQFPDIFNTFTMECWVKPAAERLSTGISVWGNNGASGQRYAIAPFPGCTVYPPGHGSAGISVGTNGISITENGCSVQPTPLVWDHPVDSTAWTHIAVVYRDRNPYLFVNGALVDSGIVTIVDTVHPSAQFGNVADYGPYKGLLDDVRIWRTARTAEELQATMHRSMLGTEPGLVSCWTFNRGITSGQRTGDIVYNSGRHGRMVGPVADTAIPDVAHRQITDVAGFYSIRGLYYDEAGSYTVVPYREAHGFRPDTLKRALDVLSPSALGVDFTDTTAYAIEGYVHFLPLPGMATGNGVDGVAILVNGEDRGFTTDSTGRFRLAVEETGTYTITPRFLRHAFSPPSITVDVTRDVMGASALRFTDTTTHFVNLYARGGSVKCNVPIGPSRVTIDVFGTNPKQLVSCFTYWDTTNVDGLFNMPLPAQRYRFTVRYLLSRIPIGPGKETVRMWNMSDDSTVLRVAVSDTATDTVRVAVWDLQRFNYHAPPTLTVDEFREFCGATPRLEQDVAYRVYMTVTENIPTMFGDSIWCDLDTGTVYLYNDLADGFTGQPDSLPVHEGKVYVDVDSNKAYYPFIAGEPNIYASLVDPPHSYMKKLQVAVRAYDYDFQFAPDLWAVIVGSKDRTQTFVSKTPELPMYMLHRPPGDQSALVLEKGTVLSCATSMQYEWSEEHGAYLEAKVGSGSPDVPLIGSVGWNLALKGKCVHGGVDGWTHAVTTALTTTETFSTSNILVGQKESASDVIVGASYNVRYGSADAVSFDKDCRIVRDTILTWQPDSFRTMYVYTVDHIRNTLLPQLEYLHYALSQSTESIDRAHATSIASAMSVWNQTLTNNEKHKLNAKVERNISFSAGAPYSNSHKLQVDSTNATYWTGYTSGELQLGFHYQRGDFNEFEAGYAMNQKACDFHNTTLLSTSSTNVTFTLNDDDPGDYFSVDIGSDPVYGVPVFKNVTGRSSCPWEPGTQSRDGAPFPGFDYPKPLLQADRYLATEVLPDEKAVFVLSLTNTSESGETRDYLLSVNQLTNIDGAVISVGGVNIETALKFSIPAGVSRKATMTIERGPLAYDYDSLEIRLTAACDGNLVDRKLFAVHFISPCSDVTLVEPADNWLVNQSNNGTMHIILTDLEKEKIGADLELEYRKLGTQKWNLAMLIPRNDLADQKFRFYETDWPIPAAVTDGTYEIRVKVRCTSLLGGGITYSNISTGVLDRGSLQVFGKPEPKDGILNFGDEISVTFTSDIDCGAADTSNVSLQFLDDMSFVERDSIQVECRGTTLIMRPLIWTPRMQNRMMRATVAGLKNTNGNEMLQPVVWDFAVNQNSLVWESANASATAYEGMAINITGRLKNVGGSVESFSLAPTNDWLTPMTSSGSLQPGGTRDVVFVVSDKLNPGSYRDTVYAITRNGNEPFYVEVNVLYQPPAWTVDPRRYQHTMEVTAQYEVNGVQSSDQNDLVAAFVGAECRGLTNIQYVPAIDGYRSFINVYSDERSPETVTFRAWDASTGKIYSMQESFPFDKSASHGSLLNPVILHPAQTQQTIAADSGWTWFSLNTRAADMTPNAVLANTPAVAGDLLKGQTTFSQYSTALGWVGSVDSLRIGRAYKLRLSAPARIQLDGTPVAANTPIAVDTGWNWIGYLPARIIDVNTAMASLLPSNGDRLKGHAGFAQYSTMGRWQGSLAFLSPGEGYLLHATAPGTLSYPAASPFRGSDPVASSAAVGIFGAPDWAPRPAAYEHTMNVTSSLLLDGARVASDGASLAAFCGGECRGIAQRVQVGNEPQFFLTVYANTEDEELRFLAFLPERDSVFEAYEHLRFTADGITGSPDEPFGLHFTAHPTQGEKLPGVPDAFDLHQNYPNPFNPSTTIEYAVPVGCDVRVDVYDALGNIIATPVTARHMAGNYAVPFDASSLPSGIYTYTMRAGLFVQSRRMIVVK
jgi:hypothetical protein